MKTYYFECQCMSDEHTLKFVVDDEDFYVSIFLNQYRGFFKRFWISLKYLFGYKCKYGHWDTWMLKPEDIDRLKELLERHLLHCSKIEHPTFEGVEEGCYKAEDLRPKL